MLLDVAGDIELGACRCLAARVCRSCRAGIQRHDILGLRSFYNTWPGHCMLCRRQDEPITYAEINRIGGLIAIEIFRHDAARC